MRWLLALFLVLPVTALQSADPPTRPTYKQFERKPVSLSEEDLAEIRRRIAGRCGLSPGTDLSHAPWYFHYELAEELTRRGDPQRALDALIEATEHRPRPERGARMYGVWFTDYLPYLRIAHLHLQLGNWACAEDALRLSQELQEVSRQDPELQEIEELKQEIAAARARDRPRQ